MKSFIALGLTAGLFWQGPNIVDEADQWRQHELAQRAKERERKAAEREAAAADRIRANAIFDSAHTEITSGEELKDNSGRYVPFSEEFDGLRVPSSQGAAATEKIRSFKLPEIGDCETFKIELPEGRIMVAARTGNPLDVVIATQNNIGNLVKVCNLDLDDEDDSEEIIPGQLFMQMKKQG